MNTTEPVNAEVLTTEEAQTNALALKAPGNPLPATVSPMTAAQSRIDAVAELTKVAVAKAGTLQLTPEESKALSADFGDECFRPGAAGKEHLIYIEHASLRDRFNSVLGLGQWAMIVRETWNEDFRSPKGTPGVRVYSRVMLIVRGCYVGEAVGDMDYYPGNAAQNYGDAFEGAKTAAFRRCAKEFGIGLQAWRKDWGDGWWQRRNQRPAPAQRPAPSAPAPTPKPAATTTPAKPANPLAPTEKTKAWMLDQLKQYGDIARDYFIEIGVLLPTEALTDFPTHKCPMSIPAMQMIKAEIEKFHKEREHNKVTPLAEPPATEPVPVKSGFTLKPDSDEPTCFDVIVPIPRAGQKRADYITKPDTIGSLYHAMKNGDTDAQHRLWGFAKNFEPKGWEKRTGEKMPPSETDLKFRDALDEFVEWHESKHPDQGIVP